jgi:hypothetical protein
MPIAINVMTLFEQTDRALTLSANQFAGRSLVLDKFVNDIVYLPLLNGGVFLAPYWWLWFEADESGVHTQRRNVMVALLAVIGVAGALKLLKVLLPFRYRPLSDPDLGLRLPFGVDPSSLNHSNSFPQRPRDAILCPLRSAVVAFTLVGRSGGRLDIVGDLFATAPSWRPLGKRQLRRRRSWRGAHAPTVPAYRRHGAARSSGALQCNASLRVLRHCVAGRPRDCSAV